MRILSERDAQLGSDCTDGETVQAQFFPGVRPAVPQLVRLRHSTVFIHDQDTGISGFVERIRSDGVGDGIIDIVSEHGIVRIFRTDERCGISRQDRIRICTCRPDCSCHRVRKPGRLMIIRIEVRCSVADEERVFDRQNTCSCIVDRTAIVSIVLCEGAVIDRNIAGTDVHNMDTAPDGRGGILVECTVADPQC